MYDTGDGHQVTALADNGKTTYAAWCGGCNPPTFARGMATNYGGTWHELALAGVPNRYITSIAVDPKNAAHVFISIGSYSRRWIPDAGVGHVFESLERRGDLHRRDRRPAGRAGVQGRHGRRQARRRHRGRRLRRHAERRLADVAGSQLGTGLPNVTVWDLTVGAERAGGGRDARPRRLADQARLATGPPAGGRVLADPAVHRLAEEVRVAGVSAVLLHEVEEETAQAGVLALWRGDVRRAGRGRPRPAQRPLAPGSGRRRRPTGRTAAPGRRGRRR